MKVSVPLQSPMGPMGQFLYSVYVHSGPGYRGYKEDSLFHGREVPDRVQVGPAPPQWHFRCTSLQPAACTGRDPSSACKESGQVLCRGDSNYAC